MIDPSAAVERRKARVVHKPGPEMIVFDDEYESLLTASTFNEAIDILVERLCSHPGFMREDYSGTDIRKWLEAQKAIT